MADAYQTRFWRTLIQLASGVYDITEWTSRSYPVYTAQIERLRLGGRRFPFKDIVGEDSSFVLSGLIYGDEDQAHILRRAMLDSDSAMPLCMQLQSKHWWLATYKMPDMPSDDDRAFFSYSMNMQSEGEDWRHGTLLDTVTSEQPATDVAAGRASDDRPDGRGIADGAETSISLEQHRLRVCAADGGCWHLRRDLADGGLTSAGAGFAGARQFLPDADAGERQLRSANRLRRIDLGGQYATRCSPTA